MTRTTRHRINAGICVLLFVYAIYQFATGAADSGGLGAWRVGAEAALGVIGAFWFWRRSLDAA